jgi:hypothetical protein
VGIKLGFHKVTVNEPFELAPNQLEVVKQIAGFENESVVEYIRWAVIKTAEMNIEDFKGAGAAGQGLSEKLSKLWSPESQYWVEESEALR